MPLPLGFPFPMVESEVLGSVAGGEAGTSIRTLKLGADGDLSIDGGQLEILPIGIDAMAQNLRTRLQFFKGEWFLNEEIGIPYYQSIFIKGPNPNIVRGAFRDEVLGTPGVNTVDRLELNYSRATRKASVTIEASGSLGTLRAKIALGDNA